MKHLGKLFVLCCSFFLMLSLFGCTQDGHQHDYQTWILIEQATCNKEGYEEATCTICGTKSSRILEKLPHTKTNEIVTEEATCTKEGTKQFTCSVCKETVTEKIAKIPHTEEVTVGYPATCEKPGLTNGKKCSKCQTVLVEQEEIAPLEHKWGEWTRSTDGTNTHFHVCENNKEHKEVKECAYQTLTTDATCEADGYIKAICLDCHHEEITETIPSKGHEYTSWEAIIVGGDEETEGHTHYHQHHCIHCGNVEKEECKNTKENVVEPTCEKGGYTEHICVECNSVHEDKVVPPTGHTFKYEHNKDTDTHKVTCEKCDYVNESAACVYTEEVIKATCEKEGSTILTCKECQNKKTIATEKQLAHEYTPWEYSGDGKTTHTHKHHCMNCNHEEEAPCNMVEASEGNIPATCVDPGQVTKYCKDCLESITEKGVAALGHKWQEKAEYKDEKTHTKICENDNKHTEDEPHHFVETITAATCEKAKTITYTCTGCGYEYSEEDGKALGHLYNVWTECETGHESICERDETHKKTEAHQFTKNNICDICGYDSLTYIEEGGHYIVSGYKDLPKNIVDIVISAEHNGFVVKEIKMRAFDGCKQIKTIFLPRTIEKIDNSAFLNCTSLVSVNFEENSNLQILEDCAFINCSALNTINLQEGLLTIASACFSGCSSLKDIDIPDSVTLIGTNVFYRTPLLEDKTNWNGDVLYLGRHLIKADANLSGKYHIENGTLSVSEEAFKDCLLLTDLVVPNSLIAIDSDAFKGCENLKKVEFNGKVEDWFRIVFGNDYASPICYAEEFHIDGATGNIVIPNGVTAIPAGTFRSTPIESVQIPDTVTSIGKDAFKNCTSLKTINIPTSVSYIGKDAFTNTAYYNDPANWLDNILYIDTFLIVARIDQVSENVRVKDGTTLIAVDAFRDCTTLKELFLPKSLKYICNYAFKGCQNITSVEFEDLNSQWLAFSSVGIGRYVGGDRISTKSAAAYSLKYYDDSWRRIN